MVAIALLSFVLPSGFYFRVCAVVFINALAVVGLNLLMGYAGQVSLGHAGFFGLGAYAVSIGSTSWGISPLVCLVVGCTVTATVALLVGGSLLRLRGYHLAVATLAFGAIVSITLNNAVSITGGPDGMTVQQLKFGSIVVSGPKWWYWLSGTTLVLAMATVGSLLASPSGRALRAIHDSEVAASGLGVDVTRYKLLAFVLSALFAALAGGYLALFDAFITPASSSILRSIEFMTMAVVGGLGSVVGSVVGAAFLVILPQLLTQFHEYEHAILGALMMITMIFMRRGIVPTISSWLKVRFK
ncbi:branched-chain amino acid ABC transporter permease [Variovorax sp. V118]